MFNAPQVQTANSGYAMEYFISLIIVLSVITILIKGSPTMNIFVVILIGLVIGFISIKILNNFLPVLTNFSTNLYLYSTNQVMNDFNSTGYYHVWPPILAVLIVFIILLYNRQLG